MEKSDGFGLSVEWNEESESFTLDWNSETHPEWNFFMDMTSEDFSKMLLTRLNEIENLNIDSKICAWRSSRGETESIGNSKLES